MHSKIYQVGTKPFSEDDYVHEEYFYDNHYSFADYIGGEVFENERKDCIERLASTLKSIFDFNAEKDMLIFKGKDALKQFLEKWADCMNKRTLAVTPENITSHSTWYDITSVLEGTHLETERRFCIEEWNGLNACPMSELIHWISSQNFKKGRKIYIGSVIDFHF